MQRRSRLGRVSKPGFVFTAYLVAGLFGLGLAQVHPSATAVWAPSGIALAAVLVMGTGIWPAIALAAFAVNLTVSGHAWSSAGIAVGNTLEAVTGAWLLVRFADGRRTLERARGVIALAVLAGMVSTMVSASIGVASLVVGGQARLADAGSVWLTWWMGDMGGDLVVAPAILLWSGRWRVHWEARRVGEALGLFAATLAIGLFVFGGAATIGFDNSPLSFLCMPVLIWAAFRFSPRMSSLVILLVYGVAVRGTVSGHGPFALGGRPDSLVLLQAFACVTAVTILTLAALVAERRMQEERLQQLVLRDSLTGLGNYRHLMQVLDAEIQRSGRTGRPFSVLFFDLDGLKKINDRHGHMVGSRALCRVAEVLRRTCRAIDTAARYGGDEFALVLPETDERVAAEVARRVTAMIAADRETPLISVSLGRATYPMDGGTGTELLRAADRAQYLVKAAAPRG